MRIFDSDSYIMKFFIKYFKAYAAIFFMLIVSHTAMAQHVVIKILPDSLPAVTSLNLVKSTLLPDFSIPLLTDSLYFQKDSLYTENSIVEKTTKKNIPVATDIRRNVTKKIQPYIQFTNEQYKRKAKIIAITTLAVMDEKVEYKNETNFVSKYLIQPIDSSNYSVNVSIEKFNTSFETMGVEMLFNSDSSDDYNTGNFAHDFQEAMSHSIDVVISDKGVIKEIDTTAKAESIKNAIINLYSGNETLLLNQQLSITHQLPRELAVGQSWTDNLITDNLHITTTYIVKEFFRDNVILDIEADITQHASINSGSKKYDALFKGVQTGEIEISTKTGLVLKRNFKISMNGSVDNGTTPIPASTTVSIADSLE